MNPPPVFSSSCLLDALRWRYATKAFDSNRQIPAETWSALEDSLVLSPSSFGLQPYRFLNVVDPATRELLMPHAWNQRQVVDASHLVVFAARTVVTETEIDAHLARVAATRGVAPESLAGYRGMMTGMLLSDVFKPLQPHWTARQAYIALGNLLTTAALLGIDTCPLEGFVPAEFDNLLGLTGSGFASIVACALGYRSPGDKYASAPKVRPPKRDLIVEI